MKTQNNPIIDETEVKSTPAAETPKTESKEAKLSPFWHSVLVGGVPGILIGSMGTLGVEEAIASPEPQPEEEPVQNDEVEVVKVAHSVNDDMSFSEAFAAARAEVGPGGAFVWHGNVYGTYRADDPEWQEMSAEERAEHSQLIMSQVPREPYTPAKDEPVIEEVSGQNNVDGADPVDDEGEVDVHIVGVDHMETEDGVEVSVGYGTIDEHSSLFADTDGDGEVDTVLIDVNDNGQVDDGEAIDVEGSGISVQALEAQAAINSADTIDDQLYHDMPDYTNDADTTNFA